ncbi:uncharacterized protein G2W53_001258 [Senna tora]|uniref:Uncharacterized protein n=1 Tax=Senna tora TaxID=362788 RepID=A0A834XGW1_9FABA|nr:uncharacterized protein G2W53_001258 [Senna tora]
MVDVSRQHKDEVDGSVRSTTDCGDDGGCPMMDRIFSSHKTRFANIADFNGSRISMAVEL